MRLAALAFLACFAAPVAAQSRPKPDTHSVTVIRSSDAHRGVPIQTFVRDSITRAEIRQAARAAVYDAPVVEIVQIRGDTAYVHVGTRVSWTQVRVVKKWVAVRDSIEVRGIR
jgi:hypothetical protein